jgi:hypothetical protein
MVEGDVVVKRIVRPFFILLIMAALMVAGCGNSADQGSADAENAEKKDLSMRDVLKEAEKALEEVNGLSYAVNGTQTLSVDMNGQKQEVEQTFKMDMDMTTDPMAVRMKGSMEMEGQEMSMEMYMVDNMLYQKTDTGGWVKGQLEGVDMSQMGGQTPNETLEQLAQLVEKFQGESQDDSLKMSKEDGAYVIDVKMTEENDPETVKQLTEALRSGMEPQLQQLGLSVSEDDIKVDEYTQKVWIDENNFQQKKMEQTITMTIKIEGFEIDVVQNMDIDLKGEFDGTITVPEEAK